METIFIVIFFSLIGGVFSLIGGFLLLANKRKAEKLLKYVTPFAAGALLAAAFTDVLPEAAHEGNIEQALRWTLVGILVFFLLERFVRWFHHHHSHGAEEKDATVPLIIIGDTIHNFIDGIAIAAAFLIDVPTGIVVTLAVAAHEIPQEIGDFGLLLDKGMSRLNVIKVNVVSALATTLAAVTFYVFGEWMNIPLGILLGLVAGFFIYIAVSDIIPSIHKSEGKKLAGAQTIMLIVGAILVSVVTTSLHGIIEASGEQQDAHSEHESHSETHED
jgi:zinc and cadmium transporter